MTAAEDLALVSTSCQTIAEATAGMSRARAVAIGGEQAGLALVPLQEDIRAQRRDITRLQERVAELSITQTNESRELRQALLDQAREAREFRESMRDFHHDFTEHRAEMRGILAEMRNEMLAMRGDMQLQSEWALARSQNVSVGMRSALPLTRLRLPSVVVNGEVIHQQYPETFPATLGQAHRLSRVVVNQLLAAYGQPTDGSLLDCRRRFCAFIGAAGPA